MSETPERIYLVPDGPVDWTWCQDRITDEDVEYVRADLAASPGGGQGLRCSMCATEDAEAARCAACGEPGARWVEPGGGQEPEPAAYGWCGRDSGLIMVAMDGQTVEAWRREARKRPEISIIPLYTHPVPASTGEEDTCDP